MEMKYKNAHISLIGVSFFAFFIIIFFPLVPIIAFGDSLDVSVDLPIFTDADKITIYGNVSTKAMLQVIITDPDEIVVLNKDIELSSGDFTYDIIIGDYDLNRSGHYTITVIHEQSKIVKQFFYDSEHNVNPMKVGSVIESLTESDQLIIFAVAATIIISVLLFLARDSIFSRKTEYDTGEWASKKNRDYEKYHSEWMSDEISFERKGENKLSDEEFRKSLLKNELPDYYAILEVQKNASQDEVKREFRQLAKKWHPDKKHGSDAEKKMAQINMAYEVLSNPKRRKLYDQHFSKKQ